MPKISPVSRKINEFYVEWSALNNFLSSYECHVNGIAYIGFVDSRVQKLWNGLTKPERKEIMKRCGAKSEVELQEFLG